MSREDLLNEEDLKGKRIQVEAVPAWAVRSKVRDFPRQNAAPVTCLLSERYIHVPCKTSYSRQVSRLETPQAVQQLSRVEIPFDPRTHRLVIHAITIFRNGVLTNHANLDDVELMRREQRLEAGIVTGELTALLLLKDVRSGDILDVETSLIEEDGLFGDDTSWLQATEYPYAVGKWKFCWIDHPGHRCRISKVPSHLSYSESSDGDFLIRSWTAEHVPAHEPESKLPPDVFGVSFIQITTHEGWNGIVEALLERWNFSPRVRSALDVQLAEIRAASGDQPEKLVDAAVAVAREGVRYQNYSPGLLAMVPEDLSVVWDRRFGDCKEKSLLLAWLLVECGYDACPVLVNTCIGRALPEMLPSPGLFDHVVTRVEIGGKVLWIDPTDLYRGGKPHTWETLPFSHGLALSRDVADLIPIPEAPAGESSIKVREQVRPDSRSGDVAIQVEIYASGRRADWLRSLADHQGTAGTQKFLKSFMETTRRDVELVDDPTFEDDVASNKIFVRARARQPRGVHRHPEYAQDSVVLAPFSFVGALAGVDNLERRNPLGLGELNRIEHEIQVDHPAVTKADSPRRTVRNPAFQLDAGSRMEDGKPVFWFTYATLKDRVPTSELARYKNAIDNAYGILDVSLNLPPGRRRNAQSRDPENHWGGGIPSPSAARAGETMEAARIIKFTVIGASLLVLLVRLALMFLE